MPEPITTAVEALDYITAIHGDAYALGAARGAFIHAGDSYGIRLTAEAIIISHANMIRQARELAEAGR